MSVKNQLALQALQSFENLVRDSLITKATEESRNELGLANFLFQNEYALQQKNIERLNQLGIALPAEVRTDNFKTFADNAGNKNTMTALGELYAEAELYNQLLNESINKYSQGVQLAQRLKNQGLAKGSATPLDVDYYQFDETEIKGLEEQHPELLNDAYRKGFEAGNTSLEDALTNIAKTQQIYATNQAIFQKDYEFATTNQKQLSYETGLDIMVNSSAMLGQPLQALRGVFGAQDADQLEQGNQMFTEITNAIRENDSIINIQDELISALTAYASADGDPSEFTRMAAEAYRLANYQAVQENAYMRANNVTREIAKSELININDEYARNITLLNEYGKAGIVGNTDLMLDAFQIIDMDEQIKNAAISEGRRTMEQFNLPNLPSYEELNDEYSVTDGVDLNLDEYYRANEIADRLGQTGDPDLTINNDLINLSNDLKTNEKTQAAAFSRFKKAALQLELLLGGGSMGGLGLMSFPSEQEFSWLTGRESALSLEAKGRDVRHGFFPSQHYALPSKDELLDLKRQVESGIAQLQGKQYGTFGKVTGRPGRNLKLQNRAQKNWNEYIEAYRAASEARGEFIVIEELLFPGE